MKAKFLFLILLSVVGATNAAQFEGSIPDWRKDKENFSQGETNFKKAFQTLKEKYADKKLSDDELYRAATEGMFAALNEGAENWNTVLTPRMYNEMQIEQTGKFSGIGATLEFDKNSGSAKVRALVPGSGAQKAGIQKGDTILSVNGKRYKELQSMVSDIRGKSGESLNLKVLREDKILDFKVTRAFMKLPLVDSALIDPQTAYLSISGFTNTVTQEVKERLAQFNDKKITKLIVDLRDNQGGLFDKGVEVADLFLESGEVVVKTKSRDGQVNEYKAKNKAWSPNTKILILTSAETGSSAEVLTAALKDNRQALTIGSKTRGKWTVESIDSLDNKYSIKYSVLTMESPSGKSYQGTGIPADFEVAKKSDEDMFDFERAKAAKNNLDKDIVLKTAVGLK